MISYVTLGTNDLERALEFYDALLAELDGKRMYEVPEGQLYAFGQGALLGVLRPADGKAATNGNGTMVALKVASPERVDEIYAKAIDLGAADEGPPGPRGERGFYAGYFRDLDRNKLCVYHM
ncbi:MAG: VOC family protein [Maricaulaceae bacterium]|jgi:predicted lactoylglutathione lyase